MGAKVTGLDRLQRRIEAMPKGVRAAVREALAANAEELTVFQKRLAPVATGALRDSIGWTFGNAPGGAVLVSKGGRSEAVGAKGEAGLAVTVFAGSARAWYARQVEFGTRPHVAGGMFQGAQHPGTAAQPFFYPAFRSMKRRMSGRVTRAMRAAIRAAAAGR